MSLTSLLFLQVSLILLPHPFLFIFLWTFGFLIFCPVLLLPLFLMFLMHCRLSLPLFLCLISPLMSLSLPPITSSGPAASLSHTEISDQLPSPLPPSTSSSLPNTHPMLTRSKHGIFKPKAYAIVRNYLHEEPPTFAITSRFPHWIEAMDS